MIAGRRDACWQRCDERLAMAGSVSLDGSGRPEIQDPTRNVVVHCCDGKFTPQEPTEDAVHDRNLSIETAAIFTNILNSCARVLAIPGRKRQSRCKGSDPALGWILALGDRARSGFSPSARGARVPEARWERPSALGRQAAAFRDGHAWQERDRLASTSARRAAVARAIRSPGTASPVPKYISSGVCPRNAECGSTWLCSWT